MSLLPSSDPRLPVALAGVFLLLVGASLGAAQFARHRPGATADEVRVRVRTWWGIVGVLSAVLLLGFFALYVFFAAISLFAWREYLALWPQASPRRARIACAITVLLHYASLLQPGGALFHLIIPVGLPLALVALLAPGTPHRVWLAACARLQGGMLITAFGLSHVPTLATVAAVPGDGICLVLYLLVLTGLHDVAQFMWGRSLGGARLVPRISPRKTWSGLVGGIATTLVLALALAPHLTSLSPAQAALAGLVIGGGGSLGDLAMSAIKRSAGVGASGRALPGHGGLLDRLDSLAFTAPLFLHTVSNWLTEA